MIANSCGKRKLSNAIFAFFLNFFLFICRRLLNYRTTSPRRILRLRLGLLIYWYTLLLPRTIWRTLYKIILINSIYMVFSLV